MKEMLLKNVVSISQNIEFTTNPFSLSLNFCYSTMSSYCENI